MIILDDKDQEVFNKITNLNENKENSSDEDFDEYFNNLENR